MEIVGKQFRYIEKGDFYLENGNADKAIEMYQIAVKEAYSNATKGEAMGYLAGGYEKKRDYKNALAVLQELSSTYAISPTDKFRIPHEERIKYLKYASEGEYELAVKHAQIAIEADAILPTSTTSRYQQRLNDLIAAKDYILSLKKTN
jgi:tetratricopeptide (TPR) repeat protein